MNWIKCKLNIKIQSLYDEWSFRIPDRTWLDDGELMDAARVLLLGAAQW